MPGSSDRSAAKVLFLGGSGAISASCVRLAVETGMDVAVMNRGTSTAQRELPEQVRALTADVTDIEAVTRGAGGEEWDAVINFLSYDADDARAMAGVFGARTRQYIHISSASVYAKPVWRVPITESSPVAPNAALAYARAKLRAETALMDLHRETGFPVTIVRPSHTYDDASPPLPGGWTAVDRIARGLPIPVHGDGTSLWTLTHSEDFAVGLVGLIANPRAIGDVFNITGDDVTTWDGIYTMIADALGVTPNLVHIASEMFPLAAPDWFWSGEVVGDIGHSAIFDSTKLRRTVTGFVTNRHFDRAAPRMMAWRAQHPDSCGPDAATDEVLTRLTEAYADARAVFERAGSGRG